MNQVSVTYTSNIIIIIKFLKMGMWNAFLLNIIVLQEGNTPIDEAKKKNKQKCVDILESAMVCYFSIIIQQCLLPFYIHIIC